MRLELVALGPATLHRLQELERTPGEPDPWVSEVEDFNFGPAVGTHLDEPASHILLAVDGEQAVGAVVHHADESYPGAEYISAKAACRSATRLPEPGTHPSRPLSATRSATAWAVPGDAVRSA